MRLGAGSGVGAGLGAGKTRPGAPSPGVFNTISLQDIRRMNAHRPVARGGARGANAPPTDS